MHFAFALHLHAKQKNWFLCSFFWTKIFKILFFSTPLPLWFSGRNFYCLHTRNAISSFFSHLFLFFRGKMFRNVGPGGRAKLWELCSPVFWWGQCCLPRCLPTPQTRLFSKEGVGDGSRQPLTCSSRPGGFRYRGGQWARLCVYCNNMRPHCPGWGLGAERG